MVGFEQFLKFCKKRNTDSVEASARIILPYQDQTYISQKHNTGWADSEAKVFYVQLRGIEEHYGAVRDDFLFEIC